MCETVKTFVVGCIERCRGDDLCRAQRNFKGFTAEQMKEQHGQSGKTRQQILDGYKAHSDKCNVAIKTVNALL